MGKSIPLFHKKIIKKKTSSAEQRKAKHKKSTKAELKKEFLNHCQKAIEHLEIFNRISMVNEKTTHLNTAMTQTKKSIAVILSGCGNQDGAEIHEATLTLWAIHKNGADCPPRYQ